MNARRVVVALAIAAVWFSSCAGRRPLTPEQQSSRVVLHGYSVLPPPGSSWYAADRTSETIVFTKDLGSPARTFVAMAEIKSTTTTYLTPQNYLAAKKQEMEEGSPRYRVLEREAKLDSRFGDFCVRYRIRAEDRGPEAEGTPEQQATAFVRWLEEEPSVLDVRGYRFLHEEARQYEVDVSYSQRGKADQHDTAVAAEGESFVASLELEALR